MQVRAEEAVLAGAEEPFGHLADRGLGRIAQAPGVALHEDALGAEAVDAFGIGLDRLHAFGVGHDEGEAEVLKVFGGGAEEFGHDVGPEIEEDELAGHPVGMDVFYPFHARGRRANSIRG